MSRTYAADGVDVFQGDKFSEFAARVCRSTYDNSPFVKIHDFSDGHFRGPRAFSFQNMPEGCFIDATSDGVGTKVVVISEAGSHHLAARDLLAMTFGDISRYGGLPLVIVNVLDVRTLGTVGEPINRAFRTMMEGLGVACNELGAIAFKGETAELGVCVSSENPGASAQFNWSGTAIGVYDPARMILGKTLAAGQCTMALREYGFRANGMSSVRAALRKRFGIEWYRNPQAQESVRLAARPSQLYDRFLANANGWYAPNFEPKIKMHAIVHVTGGAIRSRVAEDLLFPQGLSAYLFGLWDPPKIMRECAQWRGLTDEECYGTWNGGQGALVVVDEKDAQAFTDLAALHGIEARVGGVIIKRRNPFVRIHSRFSGKEIEFKK